MTLSSVMGPLLLALGFGFVIFWHELGHFLAAKYVGIKVEQFAVGFGKAILAWRKGIGFRVGTTTPEYKKRLTEYLAKEGTVVKDDEISPQDEQKAAAAVGISETEYRLNWIPLGGYVKMLGQDDMNPNSTSADPRAFNRKSIGARMLVVSAGVIMNIIMAMIGFAIVFYMGFDAPPAVVGQVMQGSPAQKAGLEVGDRIAHINGEYQHDFTKLQANIVLAGDDSPLKFNIQKPDGSYRDVVITPQRPPGNPRGFHSIGVTPAIDLVGAEDSDVNLKNQDEALANPQRMSPDSIVIKAGDTIVAVGDKRLDAVKRGDQLSHDPAAREAYFAAKRRNIAVFDEAVQNCNGQPVKITVLTRDGKEEPRSFIPSFTPGIDGKTIRIAGMSMRSVIEQINKGSPVEKTEKTEKTGYLLPGDVVEEIALATKTGAAVLTPPIEQLKETLDSAGSQGEKVNIKVQRGNETVTVNDIQTITLETKKSGLSVALDMETKQAVVGAVTPGSPADKAGIPRGSKIVKINDKPVSGWFDVRAALLKAKANEPIAVAVEGNDKPFSMTLSDADLADLAAIRLTSNLELRSLSIPRQTENPIKAMGWGVVETTSLLKQFYISLQRMVDGTISPRNMMGPVGIFQSGTHFAERGGAWLIWFLCMISANLAVVNFLPIPIVDGGLFTFLIIEKIKGRPISPKAQTAAQIVGLALLGFVFLFATWQDISRLIYGWG